MDLTNISISVDKGNLEIIDKAAEKNRQSRSGYMEMAALEKAKKDLDEKI